MSAIKEAIQHTCPLCSAKDANLFHQMQSFGYPVKYYQCNLCGFIFQDVSESKAADADFYEKSYREVYQKSEAPIIKDLDIQRQRALHSHQWVEAHRVKQIASALDIGASTGILLDVMREKYGCQVTGVEPGRSYREFAEENSVTMFESLDVLNASSPQRFDFISMMHVLEHLVDPLAMLKDIRETLITPDGHLLVEVPNFYAHDSYELAHLTCFTRYTLTQMLRQAGFEVVASQQHGYPVSKLLPLYLLVLARPCQNALPIPDVKPDHLVSFKRKLSFLYRRIAQKLFPQVAWVPRKKVQE